MIDSKFWKKIKINLLWAVYIHKKLFQQLFNLSGNLEPIWVQAQRKSSTFYKHSILNPNAYVKGRCQEINDNIVPLNLSLLNSIFTCLSSEDNGSLFRNLNSIIEPIRSHTAFYLQSTILIFLISPYDTWYTWYHNIWYTHQFVNLHDSIQGNEQWAEKH